MITLLLLVRATYIYGVVLHAHPVRGESHNQRNTTGEVATLDAVLQKKSTKVSWIFSKGDVSSVFANMLANIFNIVLTTDVL